MPYVKDFSELTGRGSFDIDVPQWVPLTIEYGYGYISLAMYFFWRVKGTNHTFRINYNDLMLETNGNVEKHISDFLKEFRKEYLGWAGQGFPVEWMREYHREYRNFIEF